MRAMTIPKNVAQARAKEEALKSVAKGYLKNLHLSDKERQNNIIKLWSQDKPVIEGNHKLEPRIIFKNVLQSINCSNSEDLSFYMSLLQQAAISNVEVFKIIFSSKITPKDQAVFIVILDFFLQKLPKDNLKANQVILNFYIDNSDFGFDKFIKNLEKYKLTSEQYVWLMANTLQGKLVEGTLTFNNATAIFELWGKYSLSADTLEPFFKACHQYDPRTADIIRLLLIEQTLRKVNASEQIDNSLASYLFNILINIKIDELINSINPEALTNIKIEELVDSIDSEKDKIKDFPTVCAYIIAGVKKFEAVKMHNYGLGFWSRFSKQKKMIDSVTALQNDLAENLIPTPEQLYREAAPFCLDDTQYAGIVRSIGNGIKLIKKSASIENVKTLIISIISYLGPKYRDLLPIDPSKIDVNHAEDFIMAMDEYFASDFGAKKTLGKNNFLLLTLLRNSCKIYKQYQKHNLKIYKSQYQKANVNIEAGLIPELNLDDFVENIIPKFAFDLLQTGSLQLINYNVYLIARIRMLLLEHRAKLKHPLAVRMLPYIDEMLGDNSCFHFTDKDEDKIDLLIKELNKTRFSQIYISHTLDKVIDKKGFKKYVDNKCSYYYPSQLEYAKYNIRTGKVLRVDQEDFKNEITRKMAFDLLTNESLRADNYDEYFLARISIYVNEEYERYAKDSHPMIQYYLKELVERYYVKLIKKADLMHELTAGLDEQEAKDKYDDSDDPRKERADVKIINYLLTSKFPAEFIYYIEDVGGEKKKKPGFKPGVTNICKYKQFHRAQRFLETQAFPKKGRLMCYSWSNTHLQKKYATTINLSSHEKKGWAACVITLDGEILLNEHKGNKFNHARFVAGSSVAFSGEIEIDEFGYLVGLTSYSGHYKSNILDLYNAVRILQDKGIDISRCKIYVRDELKLRAMNEQKKELTRYLKQFFIEKHLKDNYETNKDELMYQLESLYLFIQDKLKHVDWDYVKREMELQYEEGKADEIITKQMIDELNEKLRALYEIHKSGKKISLLESLIELGDQLRVIDRSDNYLKTDPYTQVLDTNSLAFNRRLESCSAMSADQFLKKVENYNDLIAEQLNKLVNSIEQDVNNLSPEVAKQWGIPQVISCFKRILDNYRQDKSINLVRILTFEFNMRNYPYYEKMFSPILEDFLPISKENFAHITKICSTEKIDIKMVSSHMLNYILVPNLDKNIDSDKPKVSTTTSELIRDLYLSNDELLQSSIRNIYQLLFQTKDNLSLLGLNVEPNFFGSYDCPSTSSHQQLTF